MKRTSLVILFLAAILFCNAGRNGREFRGAWLHTVFQNQYRTMSTQDCRQYIIRQLDSLQTMGINAVIFQVRPQADAFYNSKLEPWSCYLTKDGKAPVPYWDPLEFIIEAAHDRGMELHAWLNPYRVTSTVKQASQLPQKHLYRLHPERFVEYGGKLYFDPALAENRKHICNVVADIVGRYDVDAIHFDDYFYPYPIKGKAFPDDKSFKRYGQGLKHADWRRKNVDMLIEDVSKTIRRTKPWVRFGISPFGIYRNKTSHPEGSDTRGLENYGDLYADVLLWARKGWIDYLAPQLYWELDHKAAAYRVLADWWSKCPAGDCQIYIGQDVERTMNKCELHAKHTIQRGNNRFAGAVWWPGYALTRNVGGIADSLSASHYCAPALPPAFPILGDDMPAPPERLKPGEQRSFSWNPQTPQGKPSDVVRYAVYRFESRHDIDIDNEDALVAVVAQPHYTALRAGIYVVTALSRTNIESEPSKPIYIQ